jgi:ParB-like chromosome segregation protein Spo0J
MQEYEFHEVAEMFPMLPDDELQELADDIARNGMYHPIRLYEGKILDGRNRYRAAQMAGVEPTFEDWEGDNPVEYVLSENLYRRHLTVGQRAMALVDAGVLVRKRDDKGRFLPRGANSERTDEELARNVDISPKSVQLARRLRESAPDLAEKVRAAEVDLYPAYNELKRREKDAQLRTVQEQAKETEDDLSESGFRREDDPEWQAKLHESQQMESLLNVRGGLAAIRGKIREVIRSAEKLDAPSEGKEWKLFFDQIDKAQDLLNLLRATLNGTQNIDDELRKLLNGE